MKKQSSRKNSTPEKMFFRAFLTLVLVLTLIATAGVCVYMIWEDAPEINVQAPTQIVAVPQEVVQTSGTVPTASEPEYTGEAPSTQRRDGVYTILLVGNDNGFGNTDTIIVCRFDTENHTVDCVSIPRDTYVNVNWNIRKINAIYAGTVNSGGVGIDGLRQQIKNLIGFDVDCYAIVDLNVFVEAIDLLGGVYFDVPCDMNYEDPKQDLTIHINKGYQLLDGYQAMGVCRFRSGYPSGDLGRIETQHLFLKACAEQFISLGNIPNASKLISLLSDNIETNLSSANIAFFIRQGLKCSADSINFYTMPNTPQSVQNVSYTFIKLNEWLDMINYALNPFSTPISESNLDIVYMENWAFKSTAPIRDGAYLCG